MRGLVLFSFFCVYVWLYLIVCFRNEFLFFHAVTVDQVLYMCFGMRSGLSFT